MLLVALAVPRTGGSARLQLFFLEKQELRSCLPGWDSGLMTLPPHCCPCGYFGELSSTPNLWQSCRDGGTTCSVVPGALWAPLPCWGALGCWEPGELEVGATGG